MSAESILKFPDEKIAASVVASMTHDHVLSSNRMTTGEQYFVFSVKTNNSDYVIRMTTFEYKNNFISAIYWQEKLLPLGIPLAKFIQTDLDGHHSPFPALLMHRLPGDDLCNVYPELSCNDKESLANEVVKIHALTHRLPGEKGYGHSYLGKMPKYKSWYDFILDGLQKAEEGIKKSGIFDLSIVETIKTIAKGMKKEFDAITPRPFLSDVSERNLIVYQGKVSGVVDVDDICFGDPLTVLGLTYSALECIGYDTIYPDYWADNLQLTKSEKLRVAFYRLYFTVIFMGKHLASGHNKQKIIFDEDQLNSMYLKYKDIKGIS